MWVGNKDKEKRIKDKGGNEKHGTEGEEEGVPGQWTPPHLAEQIRAAVVTDGERKTITALFADLKGSTALIEGLDPEEARAILDPALQVMMDAVHRYEGYVAQALGDGIFALFGAPIAHEDHPQRALYAALRMQEEMRRYSDQIRLKHGVPLAMRVGINTGEVVVRSIRKEDLHTDYVPVGHSTNLAARMEQMATPGSILITEYTKKLIEGYFELKALGAAEIKGVGEPLSIYEVLGAGHLRTRLQVTAKRRGLTRFVGRQSEMAQIQHALMQAKVGRGQIVGVMGEPGLGKSRLFYEFKLLSQSGCLILEAYSVSHGTASPYLPLIELLKSYFDISAGDDERKRREKVIGKVLGLDRNLEDTLPYLFALLGIEEQPSPLQQMDPQIRRRRTFEALKRLFLRESLNQPLLLVFEDLHWIDSETQGFLDTLSEGVASAKILLLVNYRPEYRHDWGSKTYYAQLRLVPFGTAEAEEFLDELLGTIIGATGRSSLHDLKQLILAKTEGTPFFIEEVIQTLLEDGTLAGDRGAYIFTQPVTKLQLPPTVQGVLAARIDRLAPEEKALLQQLAVIGREFSQSLVRQVLAQPEEEIYRLLASLQHKEFLYEQPAVPEVEYIFKHALTQEVAYNSVLLERRKVMHEQIGQAIEQLYYDRLEEHYSELAHHYSRSNNTEKAIEYLQKAGQQAVQRSAYADAGTAFTTALVLLQTLPETRERTQQELALQIALASVFLVTKGYTSQEVGQTYTRARELCLQLDDTTQLIPVVTGQWLFYSVRAEHRLARELANHCLQLAHRTQDSAHLLTAHYALGQSLLWLGEIDEALQHLRKGRKLYDAAQHHSLAARYGEDPGVVCLAYEAHALFILGYPDQALHRSREAIALAKGLADSFSLAEALVMAAYVRLDRREPRVAQEEAEGAIALAREHDFPSWITSATIFWGWAIAELGKFAEGTLKMCQGLADYRASGAELGVPNFLAQLAEAQGKGKEGKPEWSLLDEALALIEKNDEHWREAEVYRLKGELRLQQEFNLQGSKPVLPAPVPQAQVSPSTLLRINSVEGFQVTDPRPLPFDPQGEAEACFLKAIEVAQKHHAKSWELRATMSLTRLWQQQGKPAEAHRLLSEVYNWFTEGFDTKDLQEAKALLDSLASGV